MRSMARKPRRILDVVKLTGNTRSGKASARTHVTHIPEPDPVPFAPRTGEPTLPGETRIAASAAMQRSQAGIMRRDALVRRQRNIEKRGNGRVANTTDLS